MAFIAPKDSVDILLVGRTGDGKSETGNTIVGRNIFATSNDAESETQTAQYDWCHIDGNNIKVVDSPGLKDTRLGVKDDVEQLINAVKFAIANNPIGYHAILYVIKFGNRYTKEDELTLFTLKVIFGDDFIENHGILIMTYGDNFVTDTTEIDRDMLFDNWLQRQKNPHFQSLLKECQNRVVLFDNRTKDCEKKIAQVKRLVESIQHLSVNGKRYTNEDFEKVERKRIELIAKLSKEQEKQEVMDKIGPLISKIKNATDNEEGSKNLSLVSREVDDLDSFIRQGQVKNSLLEITLSLTQDMGEALKSKKRQVANILAYTNLLKEKRTQYDKIMDEFQNRHKHTGEESQNKKEKEKELRNIEKEMKIIDEKFQKSRENDLKETEKKIKYLEERYTIEKHNSSGLIIPHIIPFMKRIFSIDKIIARISGLFSR